MKFSKSLIDDFYDRRKRDHSYKHQRLGQSFCNHFQLYKSHEGRLLDRRLWNVSDDEATKIIESITDYQQ